MSTRPPSLLARATAVLAVGLVLALSLLSANPELHAWAHGHEHATAHSEHEEHETPVGDAGHECAVTLFAHGVEILLVFCLVLLARPLARSNVLPAGDQFAIALAKQAKALLLDEPTSGLDPSAAHEFS